MLQPPRSDQPHYSRHLGDTAYWTPYVNAALIQAGIPTGQIEAPFVGTFPTFLVGPVVVKMFGERFDGLASYATELAMHELLADHPDVPAPELLAHGDLFLDGDGWAWPYLITRRLFGEALRTFDRSQTDLATVATSLGLITARLHLMDPPVPVAAREPLGTLRRSAPQRLVDFGLPPRLAEQAPGYLTDAEVASVLVHGDITADHVFIQDGKLTGIIDWGDSIVADRFYEFVPLYLDAFNASVPLLDLFLSAYGLVWDERFARRALQGVLEFRFNAIARVAQIVDLSAVASLDELAERLFLR